ncbi:PREDICTED: apoptosis facilitator Bcl-2-like protein 14 [Pterocles gutturalis]|uniref:apoptosis facilitator Bcl-2-like protein 14 n=1 Tax=Pterocles gutturalis TaxID=240206 RepID=UPI000528D805|nr:PREDICTED: apoptosis facilitator Bcl-2-like protein 14 [Pterocles gutturalis]
MSSPKDRSMEVLLDDDDRDSIEYKILMAYAQRRLSVSSYVKLLKNEANTQKSSSLTRRKVLIDHQRDKDRPSHTINCLLYFPPPSQSGERADVNHIADKLAKLVTSRSQESPSDVSFKTTYDTPCREQDDSVPTGGSEGEEHDEEKIIQTIVSLLRESGDRLEEKMKKDTVFSALFEDMLTYTFFERITDSFLENVSADSTNELSGHQVQCTKVAFTMEVATRLNAVDNHPMNLVLGFGLKYLREHFKPWIQDQGGWEKALTSLDQEEVE